MQDPSSEQEARTIIENRILPSSEHRTQYLSLLADAIAEANYYGGDNWAVTCEGEQVRLHVGHYIAFTLEDDKIWLALDNELLQSGVRGGPSLSDLHAWGWTLYQGFPEYKDTVGNVLSKNGYYEISAAHAQAWPEIRRLHFEFLYKAHRVRSIDPRTPPRHASGVLKYLRRALGRPLPDPVYLKRDS